MGILVSYPRKESARILDGAAIGLQAVARQPIQIRLGYRLGRRRHWFEFYDGLAVAGDNHTFSLQCSVDQFRQVVFGFCNAISCHLLNIAIR